MIIPGPVSTALFLLIVALLAGSFASGIARAGRALGEAPARTQRWVTFSSLGLLVVLGRAARTELSPPAHAVPRRQPRAQRRARAVAARCAFGARAADRVVGRLSGVPATTRADLARLGRAGCAAPADDLDRTQLRYPERDDCAALGRVARAPQTVGRVDRS